MFTHGFVKQAAMGDTLRGVGRIIGSLGEKGTHLAKRVVTKPFRLGGAISKGIREGATASSMARQGKSYQDVGSGLAKTRMRQELEQKAIKAKGAVSPQMQSAIKKKVSGSAPTVGPEDKAKIVARAKKMKAAANQKPSFAQRHPFLTAGGAFLAGSYALGGGKDQQQQQAMPPQITYGNY